MSICKVCDWHFDPQEDRYCSGCGRPLAQLTVFPSPTDGHLVGFKRGNLCWELENIGETTIWVNGFEGSTPLEVVAPSLPFSIEPGDTTNFKAKLLVDTLGRQGPLILKTSAGDFPYELEVADLPQLKLSFEGREVAAQDTCYFEKEKHMLAGMLQVSTPLYLQALALKDPTPMVTLEAPLTGARERIDPDTGFSFKLFLGEALPEEFSITLNLAFFLLDEQEYLLTLREHVPPCLQAEPSIMYTGRDAIFLGSSRSPRPRRLKFTLTNFKSAGVECASLRLKSVSTSEPWLIIENRNQIEGQILHSDGKSSETTAHKLVLECVVYPDHLPQEAPAVQDSLVVQGSLILEFIDVETGWPDQCLLPIPVELFCRRISLRYPLAIDFGTTNTCICFFPPRSNQPRMVMLDGKAGDRWNLEEMPTGEYFKRYGDLKHEIEFGSAAWDLRFQSLLRFKGTAWGFKRLLRHPDLRLTFVDETGSVTNARGEPIQWTPIELTSLYLEELYQRFEEDNPYSAEQIILTFPAVFRSEQREALRQAAERLGKEVILKISEPEALVLDYVYMQSCQQALAEGEEQLIAVFDFGGGTTDITVARYTRIKEENHITILASDGDETLGGDLLTFLIAKRMYDLLVPVPDRGNLGHPPDDLSSQSDEKDQGKEEKKQYPFPENLLEVLFGSDASRGNYTELADWAEIVKTNKDDQLDRLRNAPQSYPFSQLKDHSGQGGKEWNASFSIKDFEQAIQPAILRGLEKLNFIVKKLYDREKISTLALDVLLLAGNSSRLYLVQELAKQQIKIHNPFTLMENPKTGVARGACGYGFLISADFPELHVEGIQKLIYSIGNSRGGRFYPIFEQWTPLESPVSYRSKPFLVRPTLRSLTIYENRDVEDDTPYIMGNEKVILIGEIPLPPECRGKWAIFELYLDQEGLLYSLFVSHDKKTYDPVAENRPL